MATILDSERTVPAACAACGRDMHDGRVNCIWCGWEPGRADSVHGAVVREDSYREGATLARFALATLLFGPLCFSLGEAAVADQDIGLLLLAVFAFLPGPGVLLLQIARRMRGTVATTSDGVEVGGGELIPWRELELAELDFGAGIDSDSTEWVGKVFGGGSTLGSVLTGRGVVGLLVAPLLFLSYVVVPGLLLISPWHERVILHRGRGDKIVLHDVRGSMTLVNSVNSKVAGPCVG